MKTLTLLRHAKSSWKDTSLQDHDRPLSRRGHRDAPVMADRIKDAGIRPSLILSSPAARTWETAKIVAREIGYPAEFLQREDRLYHASVMGLLKLVAGQDAGFNNIMIVGHNPGLTELANFLSPELTDNIPTCGVVSFEIKCDDWDLAQEIETELLVYDYPKRLAKRQTEPAVRRRR